MSALTRYLSASLEALGQMGTLFGGSVLTDPHLAAVLRAGSNPKRASR